jgi:hypothetical protein
VLLEYPQRKPPACFWVALHQPGATLIYRRGCLWCLSTRERRLCCTSYSSSLRTTWLTTPTSSHTASRGQRSAAAIFGTAADAAASGSVERISAISWQFGNDGQRTHSFQIRWGSSDLSIRW